MKIRVKEAASKRRVVIELDDNSCTISSFISAVVNRLNVPREKVQLSLNHGKTFIEACDASSLSDLGIVSGDLITCVLSAEDKMDNQLPPAQPCLNQNPPEPAASPRTSDESSIVPAPQTQMDTKVLNEKSATREEMQAINKYLNSPALIRESTAHNLPDSFCVLMRDNKPESTADLLILACHQLMLESGFICLSQGEGTVLGSSKATKSEARQVKYSHFLDREQRSDGRQGSVQNCTVAFVVLGNNLIVHGILPDAKNNPCITMNIKHHIAGSPGDMRILKPPSLSRKFKDGFILQLTLNLKEVLGIDSLPPILDLPYEVTLMILKALDFKSVLRFRSTCKTVNDMCVENEIWRRLFLKDFTSWGESDRRNINWYEEYKNRTMIIRRQRQHESRMRSYYNRQPPAYPMIPRGDPFLWSDERYGTYGGELEDLNPPFELQRHLPRRPNPAADLDPSLGEQFGTSAIDRLQGIGAHSGNNLLSHNSVRSPRQQLPRARFL